MSEKTGSQRYDTSKPNIGRMADYLLGGFHNFEVDRVTADQFNELSQGMYQQSIRSQRAFLQRAMAFMAEGQGLTHFLDFGSGSPTAGNVHDVVQAIHPEAKVVYSDTDAVSVAYGQELLHDNPRVSYVYCDVNHPEELFNSPEVTALFNGERRVGIGFVGVVFFVSPENLGRVMHFMYDWAAPGSYLAMTAILDTVREVPGGADFDFKANGWKYLYSKEDLRRLLAPWQLAEPGMAPGMSWGLQDYQGNPAADKGVTSLVVYKP